jgi:hypothetical protein
MKRQTLTIGDCLLIPLPDGRFAYGQYVFQESGVVGHGILVKIFDLITDEVVPVERLQSVGELFPPVFVGLNVPLRSGRWKKIGNLPVKNFKYPKFKYTLGTKPGKYNDWSIWDGEKHTFVGTLKPEQRYLEYLCVWGDELIEERIATGINPFDRLE